MVFTRLHRKIGMLTVFRRISYLAILLLAIGWTVLSRPSAGAAGRTSSERIPAAQVGFAAPSFTLTGLDGQAVRLSDYQGKPVMLNFWASWCRPCRSEMPAIQQTYQAYQSRGLVVLEVNASYQDTPAAMRAFLGSLAYSYPILLDESGEVNRLYGVSALPTTFFISRDGTIQDVVIGGPMTFAGLSTRVQALLQEVP